MRLADLFPESLHVFDTNLVRHSPDNAIWEYARVNDLTIVTADSDFIEIARLRGAPPWIIRLENCNYRTSRVEDLLRRNAIRVTDLEHTKDPVLTIRNI